MRFLQCLMGAVFVFSLWSYGQAVDFSAGAMCWYAWWSPHFERELRGVDNGWKKEEPSIYADGVNDSFSFDPALLAGPVVNARFLQNWSIGLVFLKSGYFKGTSSFDVPSAMGSSYDIATDSNFKINRYDADATLTYRVSHFFGLFLGYKYSHYSGTGSMNDYSIASGSGSTDVKREGTMHGPGAGFNIMIPLVDTLFLTSSISILSMKAEWVYEYWSDATSYYSKETLHRDLWGYNVTAGLGYYFNSISTTCMAGIRYQYLQDRDDTNLEDKFYGVIVSAIYSF